MAVVESEVGASGVFKYFGRLCRCVCGLFPTGAREHWLPAVARQAIGIISDDKVTLRKAVGAPVAPPIITINDHIIGRGRAVHGGLNVVVAIANRV